MAKAFIIHFLAILYRRADLFSESQRIQYTIQTRTTGILDARTYLLTLKEIRLKYETIFKKSFLLELPSFLFK